MSVRDAYLVAARSARDLVAGPAVEAAWERPSALAGMSVGALACHLGGQLVSVRELVAAPPQGEVIPLLGHYERARWVTAAPDDEVNVGIRESAEGNAADGHAALVGRLDDALGLLPGLLADQDPGRPVLIPWQGWALTLDDFLVTRMMEIAVHSDDLAVSVDLAPPALPEEVLAPVLTLLSLVAVRRHGQSAVLSALSRAERAPDRINAF